MTRVLNAHREAGAEVSLSQEQLDNLRFWLTNDDAWYARDVGERNRVETLRTPTPFRPA